MNKLSEDILYKILDKIEIKTSIKYIPYGDGEQNYSVFYKKKYPYNAVNKDWNSYFVKYKSKL